jgi:hypothetical protein
MRGVEVGGSQTGMAIKDPCKRERAGVRAWMVDMST